jgi:hypothetical protein
MAYSKEQLSRIWKCTDGRCHLTGKRLRLRDYGKTWEVDHSKPRAKGGSDHGNNLKPALMSANRSKQATSSRATRRKHGLTRSPMSREEQGRTRATNATAGGLAGAAAGAAIGGPAGALVGGVLGALLGRSAKVE